MFALASQSIDVTPREKRNLTFHTFSIAQKNFEKVRQLLDETHNKLVEFGAKEKNTNSVYHVSFIAFPVAESPEGAVDA
jgi:hypothetical protein